MMIWKASRGILLAALLGVGCGGAEQPKPTTAAATTNKADVSGPPEVTKAQPKLRTIKLWLGTEELNTELAMRLIPEIMTGMMFRTEMAENEAMLFVFPDAQRRSFWMKNTLLPLSCAYIDPDGVIIELHDMKPKDETPIVSGSDHIQYVLEVKQGWFERHHIKPGVTVRTERGALADTFQPRR